MNREFDPKDYVRLFRFKDVPLILDFFYLGAKIDKNVLAINYNNERTCYFPKGDFDKALEEGLKIYSDKSAVDEYVSNLKKSASLFLEIANRLKDKEVSRDEFWELCDSLKNFYWFYDRTDFMYTDLASKNGILQKNLPEFGKIKEEMRRVINMIILGEEGLIYHALKNISKQLGISYARFLFYTPEEVDFVFSGKRFDDSICENRRILSVVNTKNGVLVLEKNAQEIADKFNVSFDQSSINGKIASKGCVSGRAVVFPNHVTSFEDLNKSIAVMSVGDILIAETTSPEVMAACLKASAIVANQGGMMSHAAIISRELGIPCIVGTENATSIFKTGDIIEVDANNGVVRLLERAK